MEGGVGGLCTGVAEGWDISTYIRVFLSFFLLEIGRVSVDVPMSLRGWADQALLVVVFGNSQIWLRCSVSSLLESTLLSEPVCSGIITHHSYISRVPIFGIAIMRASLAIKLPASALFAASLVPSFSLRWDQSRPDPDTYSLEYGILSRNALRSSGVRIIVVWEV